MKNCFKFSISIIFTIITSLAFGQTGSIDFSKFNRVFAKNFHYPLSGADLCANSTLLLRVKIDSAYKVSDVEFSDNASEPYRSELKRIKASLPTDLFINYLVSKNLNNINILVPIFFSNKIAECQGQQTFDGLNHLYSLFHGTVLKDLCVLLSPIEINLEVLNKKLKYRERQVQFRRNRADH